MVWNLFGGKKKAEAKARLQARAAMPPIMAPDESAEPPPEMNPRRQGAARPALDNDQMDALTVLAAIESAKQELAQREEGMRRQAEARARAGKADPSEDPANAVARKKQLIQAAMAVHKLKQNALDGLNAEEKARFRSMAESALGVDASKSKKR